MQRGSKTFPYIVGVVWMLYSATHFGWGQEKNDPNFHSLLFPNSMLFLEEVKSSQPHHTDPWKLESAPHSPLYYFSNDLNMAIFIFFPPRAIRNSPNHRQIQTVKH